MNKKFEKYFLEKGLNIQGNVATGKINGYEVNFELNVYAKQNPLLINFSTFTTPEQKNEILKKLRSFGFKFIQYDFNSLGLIIGANDITIGRLLKRLDDILDAVTETLKEVDAKDSNYCPLCGSEINDLESINCSIENYNINLCPVCGEGYNKKMEEEQKAYDEQPNNYLKGFGGALIGALAGIAIAFALYLAGFISSLSAFVAVLLGSFLYKKFGGKQNKVMVVILSLTTLASMVLAVYLVYIFASYQAAVEEGLSYSGIEAFNILMGNDEFQNAFISDMVMMLLFSFIGIGWTVYDLYKNLRKSKK